ncbi:type II secretion system F family protein [Aliidiomarina sp. Khilg15.8]
MAKRWDAWQWRGVNRQGMPLRGTAFVMPAALRMQLWQQGIHLRRARRVQQRSMSKAALRDWQAQFSTQWLALLRAGLAQLEALTLLQQQARHAQVARFITQIIHNLQAGHSLSASLAQCEANFGSQYCRLIEVGEKSGRLVAVLERLVAQFERHQAQSKALRKTMTYPLVVLCIAAVVVVAMLYWVVPQFASLYQQMQVRVPASTQLLVNAGDWLRQPLNWLWFSPALLLMPALRTLPHWLRRHAQLTRQCYQVPLLGQLLRDSHLLQDLSTLNLAYASSLPLTEACELTLQSTVSAHYRLLWQRCSRLLTEGSSLAEVLQQDPCIDPLCIQSIYLGEQSGRLSEQLSTYTRHLEQQLHSAQQRLLQALEPAFLVVTGVITAALLMALYLPLFQLGQIVG